MPSSVADIFAVAGTAPVGVVRWGDPPPPPSAPAFLSTGIYVVALTDKLEGLDVAHRRAPISVSAVNELLAVRPELTLDGARPTCEQLVERLAGFWFPDEVVVYIGLAGPRKSRPRDGELSKRVSEYYKTPLGANGPHAGGWPLKTLFCLEELFVHFAYCDDVRDAEDDGIGRFAGAVSDATRERLHDGERVMPFANLEFPQGNAKAHGIRGARAPKRKSAVTTVRKPAKPPGSASPSRVSKTTPHHRSQNVTAGDMKVGQVRIPGTTKSILPLERCDVIVRLHDRQLTCRWDPRCGPPERSGVTRVGKAAADELLQPGDVLAVAVTKDGTVVLA